MKESHLVAKVPITMLSYFQRSPICHLNVLFVAWIGLVCSNLYLWDVELNVMACLTAFFFLGLITPPRNHHHFIVQSPLVFLLFDYIFSIKFCEGFSPLSIQSEKATTTTKSSHIINDTGNQTVTNGPLNK